MYAKPNHTKPSRPINVSGFVAGGYRNLVVGVESDARRKVEARYAKELKELGIVRRWKLRMKMKAETAEIVAKSMPDVSAEAIF